MSELDLDALERAAANAREALLAARDPRGHWRGELSSSALSTATASAALTLAARALPERAAELEALARGGRAWLARTQLTDGGFGDTPSSPPNLSTTALGWMALGQAGPDEPEALAGATRCRSWLEERVGVLDAPGLATALESIYGEDRTFAVPILTACALGGAFGGDPRAWESVARLPFEVAALPQGLFRFLGLPVVSYALPALIAIGQVIEQRRPNRNPLTAGMRRLTRKRTLAVLERIQPSNGGFLEATPLTSFVTLSLVGIGEEHGPVVGRALGFLVDSVRADGSWPIDTDLATWGTTLAIGALSSGPEGDTAHLEPEERTTLLRWLEEQQHDERHPYTGAAPGGWAWTDLPGGVPDADDTPGALLALAALGGSRERAARGLAWLAGLQNRDGGIPTFCRGWGTLPFDMSCPDLTAHALRAAAAWPGIATPRFTARATRYLVRAQREDGAWVPLWFGNEQHAEKLNPTYGTTRVLRAAGVPRPSGTAGEDWERALRRGADWLLAAQGADGGFGGDAGLEPTIEETGLAIEALCDLLDARLAGGPAREAVARAAHWLCAATEEGRRFPPSPIGLYFAQLWYDEALYPLVFGVSGLERARRMLAT